MSSALLTLDTRVCITLECNVALHLYSTIVLLQILLYRYINADLLAHISSISAPYIYLVLMPMLNKTSDTFGCLAMHQSNLIKNRS